MRAAHGCAAMVPLDDWQSSAPKGRRTQADRLAFQRPAGQVRPRRGKTEFRAANAKQTDPLCTIPQPPSKRCGLRRQRRLERESLAPKAAHRVRTQPAPRQCSITSAFVNRKCPHLSPQSGQHARYWLVPLPTRIINLVSICERRELSQGQTSPAREQCSARPHLRARLMTKSAWTEVLMA